MREYQKLEMLSTADMSREEWLQARRHGIGGSDAAAVIGASKYTSPYALWLDKTGTVIPEDISDREAVRLGTDLEQYVADRWMESTGKRCRKTQYIYRNPNYPFAHANPDRLVIGEKAGLECKTTSSYEIASQCRKCGEHDFPEAYYCQCVHYLAVMDYDTWYLSVLVFGRGLYTFELHREDVLQEIDALMTAEREFWQMVQDGTPPETDSSESTTNALKMQYQDSDGTTVDLSPMASALKMRKMLVESYDSIGEQIDGIDNDIRAYMGAAETGTCDGWKITWKATAGRNTFDSKRFEKDHPGMMAAYQKQGAPYRRYTVKEI